MLIRQVIVSKIVDWDKIQRTIIYGHRQYHLAMMHFLDDLEHNGSGGSDMPKRPKRDLPSLLGNIKPANTLCGVELHKYLTKSLLYKDVVNQPGFAKDGLYTDMDQISPLLVAGYERVRNQNVVGLRVLLDLRNGMGTTATVELGRNG